MFSNKEGSSGYCQVVHDLARIPVVLVNAYMFGSPGGGDRSWVMIDTGIEWGRQRILQAVQQRFGDARPAAIVLTHGHFDHVGSLPELAERWDVPVFVHPLERPFLDGSSSY